jgi:hypothetical protein
MQRKAVDKKKSSIKPAGYLTFGNAVVVEDIRVSI